MKNTNKTADDLKIHFGMERKSEDFAKWRAGKGRPPLKSTRMKVAYIAYLNKFSHGEMLPFLMVESRGKMRPSFLVESNVYKQLFKINWDGLGEINTIEEAEQLIEDLVNYCRKIAGEPRKLKDHSRFESAEFINIGILIKPYFSFFKENINPRTWITSNFFTWQVIC